MMFFSPSYCGKDTFLGFYPNRMHRGSCDGPLNTEERAGCQFGIGEEKKSLIAGMPKAVVHLMALSLYWPVFRSNGFYFLL
jgi:hypothetical protein